MKVYSWQGYRIEAGTHHNDTREIVAAKSKAAAARAAGESDPRRLFNFGETWNKDDIAQALSAPGVVFWRPIDDRNGPWHSADTPLSGESGQPDSQEG